MKNQMLWGYNAWGHHLFLPIVVERTSPGETVEHFYTFWIWAISYEKPTHTNNSARSKRKTRDMEDNSCRVPNIASVALAKRFLFEV
jgi:hypothetical protein